MKKVIEGRVYDTETAETIHNFESSYNPGDMKYYDETLYRSPKGQFFIAGEGGPMSHYSEHVGSGSYSGGSGIRLLSMDEAVTWLENSEGSEVLISNPIFKDLIEEG